MDEVCPECNATGIAIDGGDIEFLGVDEEDSHFMYHCLKCGKDFKVLLLRGECRSIKGIRILAGSGLVEDIEIDDGL
jgi:Zn finger protein HypA/HybF involved in hydrogenase expression